MSWHKRDDDFELNPKIVAAGRDGALVFSVILGINSRFELRGVMPAAHWNSELLRARLGVFTMPTRRVVAAIQKCVDAGLVERTEGGELRIVGYDSEWAPRSAAPAPAPAPEPEQIRSGETVAKCSRCGKRTDGARRCADCAAQDARRRGADARAGSAQVGAGLGAATAQIAAQRFAQVGADSAQAAPRAGASESEIESESKKEKHARTLNDLSRSTTARDERRACVPDSPSAVPGEPEPETSPEKPSATPVRLLMRPGETPEEFGDRFLREVTAEVAAKNAAAQGEEATRRIDTNDPLFGLGPIYGEPA